MRRSIRDSIVGFSILGAFIGLGGILLWLRGITIGAKTWNISAHFEDASGLAERSPITYRGILVGSVGNIEITPQSVKASLRIDNEKLILPKPVFAKLNNSSLLGGDVQVALISEGKELTSSNKLPTSKDCPNYKILCKGDVIKGISLASISSLTEDIEKILNQADKEDIVYNLVESTKQFDLTQKNLDDLIIQAKSELDRAEPIITNLNLASTHIKNILAAIDNPKTLNNLQETASHTRSLTKKMDTLGSEMEKMIDDDQLMSAFRNLTIGLSKLFNEIYPSKTK